MGEITVYIWGELELTKCFFYVLYLQFLEDGIPSPTPKSQLPHKLMITQGNDKTPTEIKQKYCSEAHKTLGIMKVPNRSQTGEILRLTQKCNQHVVSILGNCVTHSDSAIAYQVYHLTTSIGYSLGTTYISQTTCHKIQGRAVSASVATSGYNRKFPPVIVLNPRTHAGIGSTPFYLVQGQQYIYMLLRHTLHNTELGRQITIDLAWVQLKAGTASPILEHTNTVLNYVQDGWVVGIRLFLSTIAGVIQFVNDLKPEIYRHNDGYIMDIFRQQGISTAELRQLNWCRFYFQVAQLSDIITIAGHSLSAHILPLLHPATVQHNPVYLTTTLIWPRQPRPDIKANRLWLTTIKCTLVLQVDGRFRQPLGRWHTGVDQRDRQYPTIYYHAHTSQIHQFDGIRYRQLSVHTTNRRILAASITGSTRSIHTPGRPVDVIRLSPSTLTAQYTPPNQQLRHDHNHTYHHRFRQLPSWAADLLQHLDIYDKHVHLLHTLDMIEEWKEAKITLKLSWRLVIQ
jgi:hypothetical protein